jgi:hypothetical protein
MTGCRTCIASFKMISSSAADLPTFLTTPPTTPVRTRQAPHQDQSVKDDYNDAVDDDKSTSLDDEDNTLMGSRW